MQPPGPRHRAVHRGSVGGDRQSGEHGPAGSTSLDRVNVGETEARTFPHTASAERGPVVS